MTRAVLRDWFLGLGLRALARLPLPANQALGTVLGWLVWVLPTRAARITRINLRLCFPEQTPAWRRRVARRSLVAMAQALTEAPWLWRADAARLETLSASPTPSQQAAERAPGQALFLVTPHLGSWEFAGLDTARFGTMTTFYSPLPIPELDRWVRAARASTGARLAPANREGLRQLQAARNRGELIGILPDQSPRQPAVVFAPFFGQPTPTMTLLPRLLRGREDRVIFLFAERLPRGRGFRYHQIDAGPEVADPDPQRAAEAINRLVETLVRQCPEQYNWAYKRFHPAPPGTPSPYRR